MLLTLPAELVVAIIRALHRDVPALRNTALVCRALLPIAREELFTMADARALEQPFMQRYFDCIVELVIGPGPATFDFGFVPYIQHQSLPKLKSIRFSSFHHPGLYSRLPAGLFTALNARTTVTDLALSRAIFRDLRHAQALICALPNLSSLSLREVNFMDFHLLPGFSEPPELRSQVVAEATTRTRPRLTRLSVVPSTLSAAASQIARWLAEGPSAQSLKTLVMPYQSTAAHLVLEHFGHTIEDLRMPLHALDTSLNVYSGYLSGYTNVRKLTVFLEAYNTSPGPWFLLGPLFEHGIPTETLRTVVIDVRIAYRMQLFSAIDWAALDRVNEALDEDKFEGLRKVVFIVQWKEGAGWVYEGGEKKTVRRQIEERLYNLVDAGKRGLFAVL